jgi:hypothetical protein
MDFYENPPKTIEDVERYLTAWLTPLNTPLVDTDTGWIQTHGFRRAFEIHAVLHDPETDRYAFHVGDSYADPPNMGIYDSYDVMIKGVAVRYAKLWKLDA